LYPADIATNHIQAYIRQTYKQLAQTRKVVSYGIVQMLYTTAVTRGYNKGATIDNALPPELLNENATLMPFYKSFTLKNLSIGLNVDPSSIPDQEWKDGWEASWNSCILQYNHKSTKYFNKVARVMPFFKPQM
jgi:hypothetical protein